MSNNVILFPQYEELNNEIIKLKENLCDLLSERDELTFVQCKNIEAKYMVVLGTLEIALFKIECKVLRAKRKLSMIQQKINRKETVNENDLDKLLDDEFEKYQQQLDEQIQKLNYAISYAKSEFLTDEEAKELKRIYYKVVKCLHPDLNPDLTSNEVELFYRAVAAYDAGDIDTMRIIETTLINDVTSESTKDTIKGLLAERDFLLKMVKKVEAQITEIKNSFPYNAIEILEDESRLTEKKSEYEALIEQNTELYKNYKDKINELLRSR